MTGFLILVMAYNPPWKLTVGSWNLKTTHFFKGKSTKPPMTFGFKTRWWFQRFFIYTPIPGEMIQFDSYFSNGLKPPSRLDGTHFWANLLFCSTYVGDPTYGSHPLIFFSGKKRVWRFKFRFIFFGKSSLAFWKKVTKAICFIPSGSMYGIFTYIWLIFMVNVGIYTIHGSYGIAKKLWTLCFFSWVRLLNVRFLAQGRRNLFKGKNWCVRVQWMLLSGCLEEVWGRNKCHFSHSAECHRAGLSAYLLIRVSFEQRQHNPDMTCLRIASQRWRNMYIYITPIELGRITSYIQQMIRVLTTVHLSKISFCWIWQPFCDIFCSNGTWRTQGICGFVSP